MKIEFEPCIVNGKHGVHILFDGKNFGTRWFIDDTERMFFLLQNSQVTYKEMIDRLP